MRRASVWALLGMAVVLGVLSWQTSAVFGLYIGLLVPSLVFHWLYACRRCNNLACAINAASPDFLLGRPRAAVPKLDRPFSDLPARVAGMPLVFAFGIGLYGAWQAGIGWLVACVLLLGVAAWAYSRVTCANCTNDCPANRNAAYREWKTSVRSE